MLEDRDGDEFGDEGIFDAPDTQSVEQANEIYTYTDLDLSCPQIRLLSLAPAKDRKDAIHCTLRTTSLEAKPKYRALSYTWGDATEKRPIFVNGRQFQVTPKLYIAILHIRHPKRHRSLWIDAICINQSDDKEKSHQVLQMRNIYSLASQVLIWLGTSDSDVDKVMAYFAARGRTSYAEIVTGIKATSILEEEERIALVPGLRKLFEKPWFTRIWVVQEYSVSQNPPCVGCGDTWVSWSNFESAMYTLRKDLLFCKPHCLKIIDESLLFAFLSLTMLNRKGQSYDFEDLLIATSDKKAEDPKDKIFALLGLTSDEIRNAIVPNYSQSINTIFQNAMMTILKSQEDLEFLRAAVAVVTDPVSSLKLPSWCLDFSNIWWYRRLDEDYHCPIPAYPRHEQDHIRKSGGNACGAIAQSIVRHDPEKRHLSIEGTFIGRTNWTLSMVCATATRQEVANSNWKGIESCLIRFRKEVAMSSFAASKALSSRLGEETASKILSTGEVWRTIAGGKSMDEIVGSMLRELNLPVPKDYSPLEMFAQQFSTTDVLWFTSDEIQGTDCNWENLKQCIIISVAKVLSESMNHTFLTTDPGYMAKSGPGVREGDYLCILFGCREPAVLRPCGVD